MYGLWFIPKNNRLTLDMFGLVFFVEEIYLG